jgi:hypothetical protein
LPTTPSTRSAGPQGQAPAYLRELGRSSASAEKERAPSQGSPRGCVGRADPNPNSSTPTPFTIFTGSSNIYVSLGTSAVPISAYQFTLNTQSSAGAKVILVTLQSGVGRGACLELDMSKIEHTLTFEFLAD